MSMEIIIKMDLDDEFVDEDHPTGITAEAYEKITDALNAFGIDIEIDRA